LPCDSWSQGWTTLPGTLQPQRTTRMDRHAMPTGLNGGQANDTGANNMNSDNKKPTTHNEQRIAAARAEIFAEARRFAAARATGNQAQMRQSSEAMFAKLRRVFIEIHGQEAYDRELPGIVAWLIEGARDAETKGLGKPPKSLFDEPDGDVGDRR
jgi:hypothetical protein